MSMTLAKFRHVGLLAVLLLSACAAYEESSGMDRAGTWRPTGVNNDAIQAMAAVPAHLDRGVGDATERGSQGASMIDRLLDGRRRPLPINRTSNLAGSSGGAAVQ